MRKITACLLTILGAITPTAISDSATRNFGSYYYVSHYDDQSHQQDYNYYNVVTKEPSKLEQIVEPKTWNRPASNYTFSYLEEDEFGPSNWGALSPSCNGLYQSPVSLAVNRSLFVRKKRPLELWGLQSRPTRITLVNEGGSAAYFFDYRKADHPRLRGGPLKVDYMFYQFHYHLGSEHSLEGQRSTSELHLVFYNSLYESYESAQNQADGIAVIALLYDVLKKDRIDTLNKWTRYLSKVIEEDHEYSIPNYGLFSLSDVTQTTTWPYFSYEGSLTTPPCSETVQWIVVTQRMMMTKSELKKMRQLKGRGGEWVLNSRPNQALNFRRVFLY
ncbi:carbonic anhydrase 13-like [Malaya genurostris]|uniref:carbonic anhydrase 13-like n=1 Tax=Malaya genurostris TaxID=325434 RepID=UPI0026F39317|nr:carbonic anhydrase 13-like [Malaya genurostris]XP_058461217.1 carbonic anhydrase 13-like [Malaya genurostris]